MVDGLIEVIEALMKMIDKLSPCKNVGKVFEYISLFLQIKSILIVP